MKYKNSIGFRLATVFGYSYRMRTDLLVNNFVYTALKDKKLTLYEPHFRRNYIHVDDVVDAIIYSIKNFNMLKSEVSLFDESRNQSYKDFLDPILVKVLDGICRWG